MKLVVLTSAAQAELEASTDWYEAQADGVGHKFVQCVDEALREIERSPSAFPRWDRDQRFRRFVMQRFPYIVFYRELAEQIEVIAVAHGARSPGYWLNRK